MKAVVYCRVSTDEQALQGFSLKAQEASCRSFAERNSYDVDRVFIEPGESAKTMNRPELQRMLSYLSKHQKIVNALIVYKVDRLSRSMVDHTNLMQLLYGFGVQLRSVTEPIDETPTGRWTKNMLAANAQLDNDVRSERTKHGMTQALKEGRWVWPPPVGLRFERMADKRPLLVRSPEAEYAQELWRLFEQGVYTQTDVVRLMNGRGYRRKLTKQTLNQILRNPLYAGLIKHPWLGDVIVKGLHEPLISEETFWRVQALLDGRRPTATAKQRNHPDFPLRNFVRCPLCDQKLTGSWSTSRTKKRYAYYHCRTKGCSYRSVRTQKMEGVFRAMLEQLRPSEAVLRLFLAIVEDVWQERHAERVRQQQRLELELRRLGEKKTRVDELAIQGTFDAATYKRQVEQIEQERLVKQLELTEVKIERTDIETCLQRCKSFLANLSSVWANAEINLKQRVQGLVFPDGITFDKNDRGGSIRTASISPIFRLLQPENVGASNLAPAWTRTFREVINSRVSLSVRHA